MGFTTGFLGGATLTYSVLYLSLYIHRANRSVQRTLLSQQSVLLNSVAEPLPPLPDPPAYEVRKAGLAEQLKDRWNREVERLVRGVHETDWTATRELYEERLANVWQTVKSSGPAREVEHSVKELGETVKDTVKDTLQGGKHQVDQAKREPRLLEVK